MKSMNDLELKTRYFSWSRLATSKFNKLLDPSGYIPSKGVVEAVDVALMLGQPLLLTGEPGTGKTQLAYRIAHELSMSNNFLPTPLRFNVKSNTEGSELFYQYDTLGRFHAAQTGGKQINPTEFISYNALGEAIIRANSPDIIETKLALKLKGHSERQRSVVLIDEIDKAPREVPNDILNEIEALSFRIPELGKNFEISADSDWRPVVIITSNSEKTLPDAFLRRCIYYHVPFPETDELEEIIANRIGSVAENLGDQTKDMISLFEWIRGEDKGIRKKPGTAELLNWVQIINEKGLPEEVSLAKLDPSLYSNTCCHTLFKTKEDQQRCGQLIEHWRTYRLDQIQQDRAEAKKGQAEAVEE